MNDLMFAKQYVKDTKPSGKESTIRDIGILGIFNYTYDNKYLFDASYRANASSQFGANNRWGSFWSVSGAWRFIDESFLNPVKNVLTDGKLRVSYGVNGTQPSDYYAYMNLYKYGIIYNDSQECPSSELQTRT